MIDKCNRSYAVSENLKRVLCRLFTHNFLEFQNSNGFTITISYVTVDTSLTLASVYVSLYKRKKHDSVYSEKDILSFLQKSSKRISRLCLPYLYVARMPRLRFILDDSYSRADNINRLILKTISR